MGLGEIGGWLVHGGFNTMSALCDTLHSVNGGNWLLT